MIENASLLRRAARVIAHAHAAGLMIATAESCTGGLIAGLLTAIPGSSAVVDRGFVTYSNAAKIEMLGICPRVIETHGAVSNQTAAAMALGALAKSRADMAVSVTGIAGPGGGSPDKPVGLVHFGLALRPHHVRTVVCHFDDLDRSEVRTAAVDQALTLLEESLGIG